MFKKIIASIFFLAFSLGIANSVSAEEIKIQFFYGDTCPHCHEEGIFLDQLESEYPDLVIDRYEVFNDSANARFFGQVLKEKKYDGRTLVPTTILDDEVLVGYSSEDTTGTQIREWVESKISGEAIEKDENSEEMIKIPFFGNVAVSSLSLPVLTVVVGALDGFNPCAMWVLLLLIALLINTKSRKRMWLIGGTFIMVSGIVYFMLLTAWLNLFLAVSYVSIVRIVIGLVALGIGVWQVRNFFNYKKGVCKVTDGNTSFQAKLKEKLQNKAKKIVSSPMSWGIFLGIVVLAFGVNLVEFFCSAGLPAVYTNVLSMSELNLVQYYLYLLVYTLIFMFDDFLVFVIALVTLKYIPIGEKYNHVITLVGGILIGLLGLLLIFKPELLMFA
jgi:thiol-disulfide isomerase/thioredoxin